MITSTFEEANSRCLGWGRRAGISVLGVILAGVVCAIIGLAFVQGSWWYSYGTDRPLDHESLAHVEMIRDEVDASGAAPGAVVWLDVALEPDAHPTDVRARLLTAQEALEAAGDPKLAEATKELRAIIKTIRSPCTRKTATPRPMPTLEWPW